MNTNAAAPAHIASPVQPIAAPALGALAGFESTCSCGLNIRSTIRFAVEMDVNEHLAYVAKRAAKPAHRRAEHTTRLCDECGSRRHNYNRCPERRDRP